MEEFGPIKIREDVKKISEKEKMATNVAGAVAEEIVNNTTYVMVDKFSRNFEKRPEMSHYPVEITESDDGEGMASFQFRFLHEIVIDVYMFDMSTLNHKKSEDWVVYEVHAMHVIVFDHLEPGEPTTSSFDSILLELLQALRPWKSPRVASEAEKVLIDHRDEIKMIG